jgi:tRNA pseudouridine38-40 synthase
MHFDSEKEIADKENFIFRLNCVLPEDIAVFRIIDVAEKAHTRFDATERSYEYFVHFDKSPYLKRFSFYQGYYDVDWEDVIKAADFIKTIDDFSSLCLPSVDFKTNICKITECKWEVLPSQHLVLKPFDEIAASRPLTAPYVQSRGEVLRFTISSNRFLRGMVRRIVGTVLMIGKGKITLDEFCETVTAKNNFRIHYLAPPNGLYLSKIKYPYI